MTIWKQLKSQISHWNSFFIKWTASVCFKKKYEVSLLHVGFSGVLITTWKQQQSQISWDVISPSTVLQIKTKEQLNFLFLCSLKLLLKTNNWKVLNKNWFLMKVSCVLINNLKKQESQISHWNSFFTKWTASVCFKENYEVSLLHVSFSCVVITS